MKKIMIIALLMLTGCNLLKKDRSPQTHNDQTPAVVDDVVPDLITIPVVIWGQSNATHDDIWQHMADLALKQLNIRLEIHNIARGDTSSFDWAIDARGYGLPQQLKTVCQTYRPLLVMSIQGEGDNDTTADDFANNYRIILNSISQWSPHAIKYIALCSYSPVHQGDPRGGQQMVINEGLAKLGCDVDIYRTEALTGEGKLHFNKEGDRRIAEEWFALAKQDLINLRSQKWTN